MASHNQKMPMINFTKKFHINIKKPTITWAWFNSLHSKSKVTPRTVYRHQNLHKKVVTVAWMQSYWVVLTAWADKRAWMMTQDTR